MPKGGSASTGPELGQGFMDLLRVRGKVGKHCPGSKDGYTVRRLEVSSKVVVGSPAYLDHVVIGGVQVVKVESQKPSGQCRGKSRAGLFRPTSYRHRRRRWWLNRRLHLKLRDRLLFAGIEELEVLLAKALTGLPCASRTTTRTTTRLVVTFSRVAGRLLAVVFVWTWAIAGLTGNTMAANSAAAIAGDEARRILRLSMDSTPDAKSLAFGNSARQRSPYPWRALLASVISRPLNIRE